jgi:hypothetical protein
MSAHEHLEQAEQVEHASHSGSKKVALFIAVLALFLALSEMLGRSAQMSALTHNVNSNDLWSFFQSKTIRMALLSTAAERMEIEAEHTTDSAIKTRLNKTIDTWKDNVSRSDDDPSTNEGRKQLVERAKESEHLRDEARARYYQYEFASAALQIGIVLASAEVITGMAALGWLSGLFGLLGLGLMGLGLWASHALDFFFHAAH